MIVVPPKVAVNYNFELPSASDSQKNRDGHVPRTYSNSSGAPEIPNKRSPSSRGAINIRGGRVSRARGRAAWYGRFSPRTNLLHRHFIYEINLQ